MLEIEIELEIGIGIAYYNYRRRRRRCHGERGRRGLSQSGHTRQRRRRGGATEELLPPSSATGGAVGIRYWSEGVDAEGFEEGVEPALVLLHLLGSEAEEEEEDVGKEGNAP